MQFFEHQDQARGRTTLLLVLFGLSVLGLGIMCSAVTHFALASQLRPEEPLADYHWNAVATAGIVAFGIILLGSAYRMAQLKGGGSKVAESLGGSGLRTAVTLLVALALLTSISSMVMAGPFY